MLARPKLNKNEARTAVKDLTSSFIKFSFNDFLFPVISSKIKGELQNFALPPTFLGNFAMKSIQTIVVRTF